MENNKLRMINDTAVSKTTDKLSDYFAKSAQENESLLNVYESNIKDELKTVINQHSILGAIAGALPTFGIATTINIIILYRRLSNVIDLPILKNLDKLIAPVINSIKLAFIKNAILLGLIKVFVTFLEASGVAAPIGIIIGVVMGYNISNKAGAIFANEIKQFVNDHK